MQAVEICRHGLLKKTIQKGYFQHYSESERRQDLEFAIGVLAQHGNTADATLLRRLATDPVLGKSAIAAIKTLEERTQRACSSPPTREQKEEYVRAPRGQA